MATEVVTTPAEEASPAPSSSKKRKQVLPELEVDLEQPEPPSKKARRALKKGKPLPTAASSRSKAAAANDDADLLDEDPTAEDGKAARRNKKKSKKGGPGGPGSEGGDGAATVHGVWIGNLPFTVTRPELFKWLVGSSGGTITEASITRVNLPTSKNSNNNNNNPRGREPAAASNKGFAYVDFATYEASVAAMALSETELGGRKLLIKDSKSFEGRPARQANPDDTAPTTSTTDATAASDPSPRKTPQKSTAATTAPTTERKIFVGNLSFATTEDDLWAHFDKCGPIDWVKVATFEDTGKCKGYGWVKFREAAAAAAAVQGFVKIREDVVTEADFVEPEPQPEPEPAGGGEGEDDGDGDGADKKKKGSTRKTKMRKWWVNTLQGRTLKIQLAEDDQVRYKKRFGKDAGARRGKSDRGPPGMVAAGDAASAPSTNNPRDGGDDDTTGHE